MIGTVAVVAMLLAATSAQNCNMLVTNNLQSSVLLCGRENGGIPGARFSYLLPPGGTYSWACPTTTATNSFETYFAIRNDTQCTWDTCAVNTGTCKSYPWVLGEGLSWQNGYWYGFVAANFDGAGQGFIGNYGAPNVQYGVQMKCSSYGTSPWTGTCGVDASTNEPTCTPNTPAYGKPDTGVVACGPANNVGTIELTLFESL